jgi:Domain of unknown function (DUF4226)
MTTIDDVLAAIKHITQCTGDPNAWRTRLTSDQLGDAATMFATSPQRLDALLVTIRHHHPDLFEPVPDRPEGAAADAIRDAEAALAQQVSATAQLDLQVVAAILNAHQRTVDGREALDKLQHDVEAAVRARTDLDTPTGARDFHRFLIGKLGEMRAVVASADLDDTSKSALMAAWTSLYKSSKDGQGDVRPDQPVPPAPVNTSPPGSGPAPAVLPDTGTDPYLDALADDDPGLAAVGSAAQSPSPPMSSPMLTLPNLGGGAVPGLTPTGGGPGGFALPGLTAGSGMERPLRANDAELESDEPKDWPSPEPGDGARPDDEADEVAPATETPKGPTTTSLPNGETVTAASPELAAVIKAAASGTPIADAFRQQGISIPPPGTAVADPIDPSQVQPGDIGMFTTRHALALGRSEALVDGQIQQISVVTGPSFLGWEHPPAPMTAGAPAKNDPPAPTRPAAIAAAAQ